MGSHDITVTTNIKSGDAQSLRKNHNGKENREAYAHENENIDVTLSHYNVAYDFTTKNALAEKHYGKKIEKHNQDNPAKSRQWDLKSFLKSIDGKEVKQTSKIKDDDGAFIKDADGKDIRTDEKEPTGRFRWTTATQVSQIGGVDSLIPILEELADNGADDDEIRAVFAKGYGEYLLAHNREFPTLPIYSADLHFDESTPHGHENIFVMGHTEKGNPSDSVSNALSEHYKSWDIPKSKRKKVKDQNKENMSRYRDENDKLLFNSIAPGLVELAEKYDFELKLNPIRTNDAGQKDMRSYQRDKDLQRREAALEASRATLKESNRTLHANQRALAQKEKLFAEDIKRQNESLDVREQELDKRAEKLALNEQIFAKYEAVLTGVAVGLLIDDKKFVKTCDSLRAGRLKELSQQRPDSVWLKNILIDSADRLNNGSRPKTKDIAKTINAAIREQEKDDGPEL